MRFEPSEEILTREEQEIPCFRVVVSHHPVVLYLSLSLLLNAAYYFGRPLILPVDPYSVLLTLFVVLWSGFILASLHALGSFFINRVYVTSKRIHGRQLSLLHRLFSIDLAEIKNVTVTDVFFARPFGYGRLTIKTSTGVVRLHHVREPRRVREEILALMKQKK